MRPAGSSFRLGIVNHDRSSSWLPLAAVLVLAGMGVIGLMLGFAGDRKGMHKLPDSSGSVVDVLPDPIASYRFEDVRSKPAQDWARWKGDGYIRAARGEAVWVRITLQNDQPTVRRGVLADAEYYTDSVEAWIPSTDIPDGWQHQVAGEWTPAAKKPLWGRDAAFFVEVPAGGGRIIYLRLTDHFGVWLRPVWWPEERTFLASQLRDAIAEAIYFGVLLALFVYNGVIWARLRHADLGYYLFYLLSIAVFLVFARAEHQLLGLALGSPVMETILTFAMAVSGFFLVQFARSFLDLARLAPRADIAARIMRILTVILALSALTLPWANNTIFLHFTVGGVTLTHAVLFVAAIFAWRAGSYHARYFVLSFGILLAGVLPTAIIWLLALPLGMSSLAMMVGSSLEMLLLSLAISDRFARLQNDKQSAQISEEKTRLELLRYQLNPHFLFNALNSIYGLVYPHSKPAGDLVRRLADFCRSTFTRDGDQWRPLSEELAMLRIYLDIEQARWRERLVIEIASNADAARAELPAFLLLPLVENAIKHGGATSEDILTVKLTTRTIGGNHVEIEVANSGRWQSPDEPRTVTTTGIGLENLHARLDRLFPETHTLSVSSEAGLVRVTLRVPFITGATITPPIRPPAASAQSSIKNPKS